MPIDAKRTRLTFQKLDRELSKLARKPAPENVHKFRTHSRRVEALLTEVVQQRHRNDEKLLKLLGRLRKKAGRVRDLDVQIESLRALKFPQANGHKSQVMDALVDERAKRERKLARAFDRETTDEIRKRLRRATRKMDISPDADALELTLRKLGELQNDHAPLTEKILHQYRIIGKRARYIAELADDSAEARRAVEQLKRMQDVIGDWHDWLKLTQKAEELLGGIRDSALVAMLRNVTQAKFRQSLDAVAEIRSVLTSPSRPVQSVQKRKATSAPEAAQAAVA
jgi:CHAD domain-containing protein